MPLSETRFASALRFLSKSKEQQEKRENQNELPKNNFFDLETPCYSFDFVAFQEKRHSLTVCRLQTFLSFSA